MNNTTLVTGLWDIKRSELNEGWNRSFEDHYIRKFIDLLKLDCNLIIFGDKDGLYPEGDITKQNIKDVK